MSCWEISLQRDEEPDHGPHYLYHWAELESEGIRSEASDVEETSTDAILLGLGHLSLFPQYLLSVLQRCR